MELDPVILRAPEVNDMQGNDIDDDNWSIGSNPSDYVETSDESESEEGFPEIP